MIKYLNTNLCYMHTKKYITRKHFLKLFNILMKNEIFWKVLFSLETYFLLYFIYTPAILLSLDEQKKHPFLCLYIWFSFYQLSKIQRSPSPLWYVTLVVFLKVIFKISCTYILNQVDFKQFFKNVPQIILFNTRISSLCFR